MRNISRSLRIAFFFIGLIVIVGGVFLTFSILKNDKFLGAVNNIIPATKDKEKKDEEPLITVIPKATDTGETKEVETAKTSEYQISDKFYEDIDSMGFEEVKERSGGIITTPNIQQTEIKEAYDKALSNLPRTVHEINIDATVSTNQTLAIGQGDSLHFINNTKTDLSYDVARTTSKFIIPANSDIAQSFDIIGEYEILITGLNKPIVIKVNVR